MIRNAIETDQRKAAVPHVIQEGARFHVLSYDSEGQHCSEPQCEVNFRRLTAPRRRR